MSDAAAWLPGALVCPSPHCDDRPDPEDISLLVIHNISLPPGQFGGGHVQAFFRGELDPDAHSYFADIAAMRVSAHFLIERDGSLTQFVPCGRRAWHAGQSCFAGRPACNDYSIGIELEGTDETPYSNQQYRVLSDLTLRLQRLYPAISRQRITGHEFIAPGRKTDPGPAFDWARYLRSLLVACPGRTA